MKFYSGDILSKKNIIRFLNNLIFHFNLYNLFGTKENVVLLYHRVNNDALIQKYFLKGIFVNQENFKQQIEFLNSSKRKEKVFITFDDGYKDNFLYAYPILKDLELNVIFFVTADFIDSNMFQWIDILNQYAHKKKISIKAFRNISKKIKSMSINDRIKFLDTLSVDKKELENDKAMYWEDLKELSKEFIVANHTKTHPNFSNESFDKIKEELEYTKNRIKEKLNIDDTYFAYPDGDIGKDKEVVENILKDLDYKYAFTTKRGIWKDSDNSYFINRIPIYYWDNLATFVNKTYGINIEDNFSFKAIIIKLLDLIGAKEWVKRKLKY